MPHLSVWMIRTALLYLGVGFTLGGLLLVNKALNWDPLLWRWLTIHHDVLLIGWTLQLALGTAHWILPRFPDVQRYGRIWLAQTGYALLNMGLLLSGFSVLSGVEGGVALGRLIQLIAVLLFARHLWPRVKPMAAGVIPERYRQAAPPPARPDAR